MGASVFLSLYQCSCSLWVLAGSWVPTGRAWPQPPACSCQTLGIIPCPPCCRGQALWGSSWACSHPGCGKTRAYHTSQEAVAPKGPTCCHSSCAEELNSTEPPRRVPKPVPSPSPAYCLTPTWPICPFHTHNPSLKMATYNWDTSQHDFPFSLDACECCLHPSPRMHTCLRALGQLGEVLAEWGSAQPQVLPWGPEQSQQVSPSPSPMHWLGAGGWRDPLEEIGGFPLRGWEKREKAVEDDFLFPLS